MAVHHVLPKIPIWFLDEERFLCYTNRSLVLLKEKFGIDAIAQFGKDGGEIMDVLPKLLWCGLIWTRKNDPEEQLVAWFKDVNDWFLDNGSLIINTAWSLDVIEALTGKRPEENPPANPPSTDGASA